MNIVITGATSFVGTNLIHRLAQKENNQIWAVVRPNSANRYKIPEFQNVRVIELDMKRMKELPGKIAESMDVFFHLAWEGVRAPQRDDSDMQQQNYLAALEAVEACHKLGCKKFICSGSQAEYGIMNGEVTEEYPCNPVTEYGKAKRKACEEIEKYCQRNQITFIWSRIFSIYGLGDFEGSLVMSCIKKMKKNEPILLTRCVQEWDYLYIDELADILERFAERVCVGGVYNVASGRHCILKEYVETLKRVIGSDSELRYGELPYPNEGMVSFVPNIAKLERELQWQSEITFEQGIRSMLQRWKNEKN